MSKDVDQLRVAKLAHQIWEAEGRPEGESERHWALAEQLFDLVDGNGTSGEDDAS